MQDLPSVTLPSVTNELNSQKKDVLFKQREALRETLSALVKKTKSLDNPLEVEQCISHAADTLLYMIQMTSTLSAAAALTLVKKDLLETVSKGMDENIKLITSNLSGRLDR